MRQVGGFTLWELVCALGVASVVFVATAPGFTAWLLDARLTADVNAVVLAVQLARSEAAKRGQPVIVCRSADRRTCVGDEVTVGAGVMVFVNVDDRLPPARAESEPLLYAHALEARGSTRANRPYFEFRVGRRSTNGTIVLCDERGPASAKAVIVSYTGRPRVANRDADGKALRCAALT
jgi:type IV fimbrial biogenesis protein FimT